MSRYRIHRFSKLTGLTPHVIRAWERRYHLVQPVRGPNRYRLYSDEDVQLFRYLKAEIDRGASIGELADLGRSVLLARAMSVSEDSSETPAPSERFVKDLVDHIVRNDRVTFERKFNGGVAVIPFEEALHRFLLPLQKRIGELWHEGTVSIAQEHYVTRQVQQKIFAMMNHLRVVNHGPTVVVACPSNEPHEIAAQTVAYLCTARGCRTHYLGANLPVSEFSFYCRQVQASLALLSITMSYDEPEAEKLAEALSGIGGGTRVGVGGVGALASSAVFERRGILVFHSLTALESHISSLKS